jgi:iron(III) transport system permease protein
MHIWKATESVSYSDAAAGSLMLLIVSIGSTLPFLTQSKLEQINLEELKLRDCD